MSFNLREFNRTHARGSRQGGRAGAGDGSDGAAAASEHAVDERLPRQSRTERLIERSARECDRRAKYVGRLQVRESQRLRVEMGTSELPLDYLICVIIDSLLLLALSEPIGPNTVPL